MKKIICMSAIVSSLLAGVVHADAYENNCGNLSITITNTTGEPCTLMNSYLYHGYYLLSSSTPTFIPPGTVAGPIFLEQGIFGPELELTYSCGFNRLVTFSSKQNYCFLSAGQVYGQVQYSQNVRADYQAMSGSWLWSQHGNINWQLS